MRNLSSNTFPSSKNLGDSRKLLAIMRSSQQCRLKQGWMMNTHLTQSAQPCDPSLAFRDDRRVQLTEPASVGDWGRLCAGCGCCGC